MNTDTFWELIEAAWATVPQESHARSGLLAAKRDELDKLAKRLSKVADSVVEALRVSLVAMSSAELVGFDRLLERALYDIDREELHKHTGGSDDGFLYIRGFIVAMGREYYEAVDKEPSRGTDAECGDITYLSENVFIDRFGEEEWIESGISRESCSNGVGWGRGA